MSTDKNTQRIAISMFAQDKPMIDVVDMLKKENHEQAAAESLAIKYKRDFDGHIGEQKKDLKKSIAGDKLIGGLSFGVGAGVTVLSFLFLDGVFFLFYGL